MFWNLWDHGHRVGGTLMLEQACLKGLLIFLLLWRKILVIELVNVKRRGENLWKIDFCIILILNIRMRFLFKNMHLSFNFGWQVKLGNQIDFCKNIILSLRTVLSHYWKKWKEQISFTAHHSRVCFHLNYYQKKDFNDFFNFCFIFKSYIVFVIHFYF